ncbi:MAG: GNAT family N-acetyltransferase [Legionellaceae bacterium]|nr:GNAT family N-acetyltransferase [Legionellaceae bacterium]
METLSYRLANLEDAEIIHQYTQEVFVESQNFLLLPDDLLDSIEGDDLSYLTKIMRDNRSIFYLAFSCSKIVGMSDGRLSESPSHKLKVGVTVHKNFRRKGIAKKLIDGMILECRRRNISELNLQTFSHNRAALALYQSCGFKTLHNNSNEAFITPSGEIANKVNMRMLVGANSFFKSTES